jgi:hypothetical protein
MVVRLFCDRIAGRGAEGAPVLARAGASDPWLYRPRGREATCSYVRGHGDLLIVAFWLCARCGLQVQRAVTRWDVRAFVRGPSCGAFIRSPKHGATLAPSSARVVRAVDKRCGRNMGCRTIGCSSPTAKNRAGIDNTKLVSYALAPTIDRIRLTHSYYIVCSPRVMWKRKVDRRKWSCVVARTVEDRKGFGAVRRTSVGVVDGASPSASWMARVDRRDGAGGAGEDRRPVLEGQTVVQKRGWRAARRLRLVVVKPRTCGQRPHGSPKATTDRSTSFRFPGSRGLAHDVGAKARNHDA